MEIENQSGLISSQLCPFRGRQELDWRPDLLGEDENPSPAGVPPPESSSDLGTVPDSIEVSLEDDPIEPLESDPEEEPSFDAEYDEVDDMMPLVTPQTTRGGRVVRRTQDPDFVYS